MRRLFEPAAAPVWLREVLASIRAALTDIWPAPLRLKDYATADLPLAADHRQGLAWDSTTGEVKRSDGSAWAGLSVAGHAHGEADILVSATDRLVGRDAAGAGAAEAIAVGGGLEFTGSGGVRRSALTGDVTAGAGSNATVIADDAVSYAKMQNVSAADRLLGRASPGAGDVEEIACSAAGRSLIAAADAQAQRALFRNGCMVRKAADQVGANYTAGALVAWDQEVYDDGGWHDNAAANSRLTVPAGVTRVRAGASLLTANAAGGSSFLVLFKNGSAAFDGAAAGMIASASNPRPGFASGPIPVSAGDYFEVSFFYGSDAAIDIVAAQSNFWIEAC